MIRSITRQKPMEETERLLRGIARVFIIGCGTCTTMTKTGGIDQVLQMKETLQKANKYITGHMVVPVACDEFTAEDLREKEELIQQADGLLIMTCAFGVQTIGRQVKKPVIPALDTLFIGKERGIGRFEEICSQCGQCVLGDTGGICPVTSCHKGLLNGPCGGTNNGKCEIDPDIDCAWTLIYNRLKELDELDRMRNYQEPRNYQVWPSPSKILLRIE